MNRLLYFSFFLIAITGACTGPDESPKALVNIFLIDAPAQWDSVLVEIQGVELDFVPNAREGSLEKIYFPYELEDKQIDVSQLVGGTVLQIGRKELNLGTITGATLRLGSKNTLYQGDKSYALSLPNGQTDYSGQVSVDLQAGISYDLIVDLDLEKSISQKSSSPLSFNFQPTIRITSDIGNGDIQGTITPATLDPAIYAIRGTDSISTHINSSGTFLFRLPSGTYNLYIDPKNTTYNSRSISNVVVEEKKKTTLDQITLTKK
ncbi:DUF4382 domain-containing protein [Algoriphagus mannitolivorans]|uniref:DUF4382 domain-containing protein n=1 Tax=Algoriphagus mannitolivorans TaxID=226504 RepID=UPI00041DE93F|nr:DUF4382 domain-containing protein [Algoriphagus mannitolivorans]